MRRDRDYEADFVPARWFDYVLSAVLLVVALPVIVVASILRSSKNEDSTP